MKNTWLRFAATAAMAGGMVLAAQEVDSNSQPAPPPAVQQHRPGARMAQYLNLSPAQVAQARGTLQAARQSAQPMRQQLKQLHAGMFQAIRANDTAAIGRLSAQEANLKGRISAMRHEAFARIYSNLTPDQRAKADQLPAHFRQMRQHWMANHQRPSNG
ncbi:MAG: Spy/CpxP family protein refolding chaperone [Bryobacteraceae bacterium]